MADWWIYEGSGKPHDRITKLPPPPPWRRPKSLSPAKGDLKVDPELAIKFEKAKFQIDPSEIDAVNAAIYLRRPLLVTGPPGTGKSTLAYAIAHDLQLGKVLEWPITTRSTLQDALYRYDAIGRLQEANLRRNQPVTEKSSEPDIGQFLRLGPLGTAFLPGKYPRVLLIDEIDKSDIDLPNDLLHIFEQGEFEIPELTRLDTGKKGIDVYFHAGERQKVTIKEGKVANHAFPIVVMTSNGEREFPPAFLRRCVRLEFSVPDIQKLRDIVQSYFATEQGQPNIDPSHQRLIELFMNRRQDQGYLATDQLLNAIFLAGNQVDLLGKDELIQLVMHPLSGFGNE